MKNLKRLLALVLALACIFALAACGSKKDDMDEPDEIIEEKEDVFDQMEEIAKENNAAGVGDYVVATEADLIWEDVDGGVAITAYIGSDTAVEIPAQVEGKDVLEIRGGAFEDTTVAGVKLPDTLVTVGESAFYYVTTLLEVKLGANVQTIETDAFHGCSSLSKIELNSGLQTIGRMAFANTVVLKAIKLPNTLTEIGIGAFVYSGLEEITIPGSVKLVGEQAFSMCTDLTKAVLENGVETIDYCAFESCEALETIEIPASVTTFGAYAFSYCDNVTIHAPAGSAAESYAQENSINFKSK